MRVTAIIPARYGSTRFPGKPLAPILGRSMIEWVYERTSRSQLVDRVIVATDDRRIAEAVEAFGGEAWMTSPEHPTGTDRLAEVAAQLECDLIVNVQGDEPLIDPLMIDQAVRPLCDDPAIRMGTLRTAIDSVEDYLNPNVVKVVCDRDDFALYFSRAPIPCPRDFVDALEQNWAKLSAWKHIGLYVYRRDFLLDYPGLPATPLEGLEKLEQLRALEHGIRIKAVITDRTSQGVDTREDLDRVEKILRAVDLAR